jgi:hypothetical protein
MVDKILLGKGQVVLEQRNELSSDEDNTLSGKNSFTIWRMTFSLIMAGVLYDNAQDICWLYSQYCHNL